MNPVLLLQIGMRLIQFIPTIEASIKAVQALVQHVHSVSDGVAAGEAIAAQLPNLLTAVVANTPADTAVAAPAPPNPAAG